jgi:hypothetical protein
MTWPIHAKHVSSIDFDVLERLPGVDGSETAVIWHGKRRWLEDDTTIYDEFNVPQRGVCGIPRANYRPSWIDQLLATGVIEQVPANLVTGWVRAGRGEQVALPRHFTHR